MPAVLAGPFITHPFHPFRISPQGVVPKKTPGHFHPTHNLSNPKGFSVNDSISSDHSSVIVMPLLRMLFTILRPLVDVFCLRRT